jgi:hypothetical protein
MEGKPTVSQKPYRGRKTQIATFLVVMEDFKAELKLLFEVFLHALFLAARAEKTQLVELHSARRLKNGYISFWLFRVRFSVRQDL